jgi:error-prone DNA polymerase
VPPSEYVELRCRSAFSFLEGASLPEELVERAAELGLDTLALADRDGVYGAPRFWKAARSAGCRAIVGADVALASGRLLLLVETRTGYRNLCKLLTRGHARGSKGECVVTSEELEEHASGLSCLAGAGHSPLTEALRHGDRVRAERLADWLRGLFPGRLWIDVQRSLDPRVERRTRALCDLAGDLGLPLVASGDVRAARRTDRRLLDVLTCISAGTTLDGAGRRLPVNAEAHLVSAETALSRFRDIPGAVAATRTIAERCEFTLDSLGYRFPEFPLSPGETSMGRLSRLTFEGARGRWGEPLPGRVRSQLEHELAIVAKLDLAGYFLIVWDIVRFCRERGILVQGRGSAANSAVCYALGITAVDAVGMELLFERFLSEERGEWPDIDLDLPSGARREEVIQYVYRRYGPPEGIRRGPGEARTVGSGVAMTANVITYRTRSAVREAGKALGFAPLQLDRLSKQLTRIGFYDEGEDLADRLREGGVDVEAPRVQLLMQCVESLRGLPRHLGQHSGGLVVAAGRLDEVVPLEPATMPGRTVVQWDKDDCADLGLIKIDLLGLGMMAALEETFPLVREYEGVALDLATIPPDDPETYAMLRRADTVGVFQVESRAQMATLPRLRPETFYDLVVEVAIIRPGPIVGQMVHPFLNRRSGREPVTYPHPRLEPILRRTLGVPLFQEQLLRIAMAVGGFTGGEAEELRRAMGFKRSTRRMQEIEARLRAGLAKEGIAGAPADEIVRSITSFALYGFPESHAASFALLAYASAYLKAHHPAAFLCALLNAWPMGFYHPATLVKDAQQHGVRVGPIDVTCSHWRSSLEAGSGTGGAGGATPEVGVPPAVRLGLRFVRGLREEAAWRISTARAEAPFTDPADLVRRCDLRRTEAEALAEVGALGRLSGASRREALWQVAGLPRSSERLLAAMPPPASEARPPAMSALEETLADYRVGGVTAGPHVLAHLRSGLDRRGIVRVADLARLEDGARAVTAGLIIVRQRPMTAKGFCFLTIEDETGLGNAVITPRRYGELRSVLIAHPLVLMEGEIQQRDHVTHLKVDRMEPLGLEAPTPPSHDFH